MATVIDELILRFSLDPRQFNQGQQQIMSQLQQLTQTARKSGGEVEDSAKKMADGFEKVTKEVLALGGAFLGVSGLKDLAVNTTTAAANLGVLSTAVNTNAEALNRWQNAARHVGIGAEQSGAAIAGLITKLQQFQAHQIGPEGLGLRAMQALTNNAITQADLKPENVENLLFKLARGARANPANAAGLMQEIPGAGALLPLLQRPDLEALLAKSQSINKEQIAAAEHIRDVFVDLAVRLETKVNELLPKAEGVVNAVDKASRGDYSGLSTINEQLGKSHQEGMNALGSWLWDKMTPANIMGFPVKSGAGSFTPETSGLADFVSTIGGFKQITAANDAYHTRGAHAAGRAIDFTIEGGAEQYAMTAAGLNRIPGLRAFNEFAPGSSAGWTAPHLHVEVTNKQGAEQFERWRAEHGGGGGTKNVTNNITVNTQPGADAHAIGAAVGRAVNAPEAMGGAH